MTAKCVISETNTKKEEQQQSNNTANPHTNEIPPEIIAIFDYLACNEKIIFKSQQIDDAELQQIEKQQIAREVYTKNRETFLLRFGAYLNEQQLGDMECLGMSEPMQAGENLEEMKLIIDDCKRKLRTSKLCIRNRRYAALQQLIDKGEYFSEHKMMQCAPDLYLELVGQYLTEEQKKERDSYNVKNVTISGILMHTLEQKQRDELLEKAQENLTRDTKKEAKHSKETLPIEYEVPKNCRQQWGGFDDEPVACSTFKGDERVLKSYGSKQKMSHLISFGERKLLRQEFVASMYEQFLAGKDKDFDYSTVDYNTQLDFQKDQEDAYFEESDDESNEAQILTDNRAKDTSTSDNESEDELDIFMQHLNSTIQTLN